MSNPTAFVSYLRGLSSQDLGALATLRRSLAGEPGTDVRAFKWIEKRLPMNHGVRERKVYYLVAGLWASIHTASIIRSATVDEAGEAMLAAAPEAVAATETTRRARGSLGSVIARLQERRGGDGVERRFITLLDADDAQLPDRLRQMVQLLRTEEEISRQIDWPGLLHDLLQWDRDDRRVQRRWASDFYRAADPAEQGGAENADDETKKGA